MKFPLPRSLALLAAISSLSLSAASAQETTPSSPPDTPSPSRPISVEGTLIPVRVVRLASRSKGVIQFISEEGDHVHAGAPLLILEDSQEKLEVDRQKKILELRAVEEGAEEQLRKKDVDSPLELAEKKLNLDLAKLNVQQAENLLSLRTTAAPFEGVVTQRLRSVGEAADELSPVLTLVDINNLYLEFHLPSSMRDRIRVGQPVSIQVDSPSPAEARGTVQLCSPVIDPASGDFEVRVLIPNPDAHLSAGVRAKGLITTDAAATNGSPASNATSAPPSSSTLSSPSTPSSPVTAVSP